jgi:hypothetical protein
MYSKKDQRHISRERLPNPMEFLARIVWFPVELMRIRVTLPTRITRPPRLSMFRAPNAKDVRAEDVIRKTILQLVPPDDSPISMDRVTWQRDKQRGANEALTKDALQSWELTVQKPSVGSCYSLDWDLPLAEPKGELHKLAISSLNLRRRLMEHRRHRNNANAGIHQIFERFEANLRRNYASIQGERFEVSAMTYDDSRRRLQYFEGTVNGKPIPAASWNFSLPFGAGLAGACFKDPNRAFLYDRPSEPGNQPELYLPVSDGLQHSVLLTLPLYHPKLANFVNELEISGVDRSRFCVGVVNIGSDSADSALRSLLYAESDKEKDRVAKYRKRRGLTKRSQEFSDAVCALLGSV